MVTGVHHAVDARDEREVRELVGDILEPEAAVELRFLLLPWLALS